eukprot:767734-Hanusia_phi.AAC.4
MARPGGYVRSPKPFRTGKTVKIQSLVVELRNLSSAAMCQYAVTVASDRIGHSYSGRRPPEVEF